MNFDEYATSFLLYAPAKNSHGWNLDLQEFGAALRENFSDAGYEPEEEYPARLSFWVMDEQGVEFNGFADTEVRDTIALADSTVDEVAKFIVWFRDSCIPSPELIRFTSELAYARGIEADWRVPRTGGVAEVLDELQQHIQVVVGE
ncbi:hypothetical protein OG758_07650 [Streptomyces sp. NBC_01474]|uniref:hypothetical protein n=1 Tax=Streptomyces sp. NBC_01474 TaxID=2903880 RepID=UPI002DD87482|nr:hypothetical protein [Streptomyces sp. NBC_01474]WSD94068.1 hypothetical protein OG758_07650 [Streptomyces sp. NBC_01474]